MAASALLALPLGAFARHPHQPRHRSASRPGTHQVQGTQVVVQNTSPPSLISLTAGTVTSFANNVLTVTLNDGQVLTGAIEPRTKIVCGTPPKLPPRPEPPSGGPTKPPFGTTGPQDYQGPTSSAPASRRSVEPGSVPSTSMPGATQPPAPPTGGQPPAGYPGKGPGEPTIRPCGTDALTPGTLVHSLGLGADPKGVRFWSLALIKPAA
jgi:hypothetical protein